MREHIDARRRFVADLFPTEGDVNVVTLQPGVRIGWHRHQRQDDYLYCAKGRVEVRVVTPEEELQVYELSEIRPTVVKIPRNSWHGYVNLGIERAILVCYISQKYCPDDEERVPLSAFEWT